jgi:hypothetical protein
LWGVLAFLGVWLTFWTAGGIAAFIQLLHADWGTRLFLLLWLCFWAFGESTSATIIAWQLFGRELLLVSPERLEVRKQIGPLTKTKLYEAPQRLLPRVRLRRQDRACRRGNERTGSRAHRRGRVSTDPSADLVGGRQPGRAVRASTRRRGSRSAGAAAARHPAADRVSAPCRGSDRKPRCVDPSRLPWGAGATSGAR